MTLFIAAGLVFGSAGVPPVGLCSVKANKITGETPALPKPLMKPLINGAAPAERKLREKCSQGIQCNNIWMSKKRTRPDTGRVRD
jgi:hypothetical protein